MDYNEFTAKCRALIERGAAWVDANLFNGEYFVQQMLTPAGLDETLPRIARRYGRNEPGRSRTFRWATAA